MNITVENKPKEFTPIKVTFEITSRRELELFVSFLNSSEVAVTEFVNVGRTSKMAPFKIAEVTDIWKTFNAWDALHEML